MSQEAHTATAIFTTISGVIGGVTKAVSAKPILLSISFDALGIVVLYASASAAAGYLVKKVLDKFFETLASNKEKRKPNGHE
jgi:hypothetical protein